MAKDPYRYFRIEAQELLTALEQNLIALEKSEPAKEHIECILRLAHTLKGAARVVRLPEIAEHSHALEDAFEPFREQAAGVSGDLVNRALQTLDAIATKVASLEPAVAHANGAAARSTREEAFETVRVEVGEMDALLRSISEASVSLPALRKAAVSAEKARRLSSTLNAQLLRWSPDTHGPQWMANFRSLAEELRTQISNHERILEANIGQLESRIAQIHDAANRARLQPVETVFASLERAARDAGESLQKKVQFARSGGEIHIDGHLLFALRGALLHVVRNAVAHGIETAPARAKIGKPAVGSVELRVERRDGWVAFICRDDGQGIDVEAIRRAAVQRGLLTAAEASSLSHDEAVRLMLKGGVTTSSVVDDVSGRGIGLDVVRSTVERLKGKVKIVSTPGQGASLEICVPMSLSSLKALQIDVGGMAVSMPLDGVRRTMRIADSEIARSAERDSIVCDKLVIPFLPLTSLLGNKSTAGPRRKFWSVIVLESASGIAALAVDQLLGSSSIVMKQLPATAKADPIIAGASLDPEGNPQLVLDPDGIIKAAYSKKTFAPDASVTAGLPILVIDDSLTTRMLEQNILESAGYEVHLAASAEEGLVKARERQYGLFLVDVEMPGMNGFEFVSHVQADKLLHEIPCILVTSRNAEADRRLGQQVGARAYIMKGEFDQGHLLHLIRNLVG